LGCSDSISSPRTGVEAILTELGPENQNWRYAVSSHTISGPMKKACQHGGDFDCATINGFLAAPPFVFAKQLLAREHAVVTSSNGIKAVLKFAADPDGVTTRSISTAMDGSLRDRPGKSFWNAKRAMCTKQSFLFG
jgi:hypothetical protein